MVNRKIGQHSTVNSNFLPNVNDRVGREVEAVNLLSSGSRPIRISSPTSSRRLKTKSKRKKVFDESSQPTVENLYKNLLNLTSKYQGEKQNASSQKNKEKYNTEQIQLGVSALNSFVIAAGNIYHGNRLIKYVVREILGTCFSIDLLVPITEQTWTIFVPTYAPVKELMSIWKRRNGTKFEDPADMDKLCAWLLSCIQLQFNQANIIVSAQFNQDLFKKCYTQEIKENVQKAATTIQSVTRRFLSNSHLREELKKIHNINESRTLALIRVRNNKKLSTANTTEADDRGLNTGRTVDHTGNGIFSNDTNNNKDFRFTEETERSYAEARQRGQRIDNSSFELQRNIDINEGLGAGNVQFNVHPPPIVAKQTSERKSRPTFSGNLKQYKEETHNIHDVSLNEDSVSTLGSNRVVSTQLESQPQPPMEEQYVSFFEQSPVQANELTKQKFWTSGSSHKMTGNQNNASLTYPPPENGGRNDSLLSLIRSHNVNILNKRSRKLQDPKSAAVYWMRQEIAALLHKVEILEHDLYEQRYVSEQTENMLKTELLKARKNAVKVAERMAKRAKEAAVEEVSARMTELHLEIEKAESEREAILLHELDTMQRRWVKRWKKKVQKGKRSGDGNTSDFRGDEGSSGRNNGDSWIDTAGAKDDDEEDENASETSLERRLRMNSLTRKSRKVRRSRKAGGGDMSSSVDSSGAYVKGEELEDGEQSETSVERRIRLNALNRKDRKNKKSRRNPGAQISGDEGDGSGSIERGSSVSFEEVVDDDNMSETSMEKRIRLNAAQRSERKVKRRSRNPNSSLNLEESSLNDNSLENPVESFEEIQTTVFIAPSVSPTAKRDRKSRRNRGKGRNRKLQSTLLPSPIDELSEYDLQQEEDIDEVAQGNALNVEDDVHEKASEVKLEVLEKKQVQQPSVSATKELIAEVSIEPKVPTPSSPISASAAAVQPTPPVSKRDTAPRRQMSVVKKDLQINIGGGKVDEDNVTPASTAATAVLPIVVTDELPVESLVADAVLVTSEVSAKSKPSLLQRSMSIFSSPKSSPKVSSKGFVAADGTAMSDALAAAVSIAAGSSASSKAITTISDEKPLGAQTESIKPPEKMEVAISEKNSSSRRNTPGSGSGKRTISRPSSNRSDRKMLKSGGNDEQLELLLKQNTAAMKIQGALRVNCRRKKYIKSDSNLSVLRADSLLRILDITRDENVLHKAFATAMELEYVLLANKSVNRSVELLSKYFKSGILFPVDIDLLLDCVHFFLKVDKNLADRGFDALAVVAKLKPDALTGENPELCDLIIQTIADYTSDPLLCFKATKCLYRMCEKNVANRLSLGRLESCLVMKALSETHVKNTSLVENFAKCLINLCINCSENQDMLGEVGICDSVFVAFIEHLSLERLFYLLCRSIINLCAGNHRPNQDRLAKGAYPSVFITTIKTYKAFPKAMEQIITCILSIVANNKPNKQKFLDIGICDVLLDLVSQTADSAILGNCFWAISTLLSATGSDGKQKELFDKTIIVLREYESDKRDEDISKQATIAINRMMRSPSLKGTPVSYVPVKRPNTGNILDKL